MPDLPPEKPLPSETSTAVAQRAVRGSAWIAGSSYVGFAINLIGTAVLARFVSPPDFGAYALAQSYTQIAMAATSFAFTQAVIQAPAALPALADTALRMTAVVRISLLFVSIPLSYAIAHFNGPLVGSLFIQLAVWQLIDAMKTAVGITLERDMEFGRIAALNLIGSVGGMALGVAVAVVRPGAQALVVRDIAVSAAVLIGYLFFARAWGLPLGRTYNRATARYLWTFGKSIYVVRALEQLIARLDRPLIGGAVSLEALGYYYQARYLASLPAVAVAPGNLRVAVATYSRLRGDAPRTARAFDLVQYFVLRAVMPFAVICFVWPSEVLQMALGPRWLGATDALRILALFAVEFPALESYRALLTATEQWTTLRWSMLFQGSSLILAFAWAAPRWGATGAAGAALVSTLVGLMYSRWRTSKMKRFSPLRSTISLMVAAIVATAAGFATKHAPLAPGLGLIAGIGGSIAAYLSALVLAERELIGANLLRVVQLMSGRRREASVEALS